ncbi:MAG: 4Fe-4S binding protein [Oscillospiraceae bacterium]|nr:4Fe-4S binding protein [Oscillospiraceae bacterium]
MATIRVDDKYCKGCGLCVDACPKHIIILDKSRMNSKGYHPAGLIDGAECSGCASCASMCPDAAITVER